MGGSKVDSAHPCTAAAKQEIKNDGNKSSARKSDMGTNLKCQETVETQDAQQ